MEEECRNMGRGEAMTRCQDILSSASDRNPIMVMVITINEKGEMNISHSAGPMELCSMVMNSQVVVQDLLRKSLRL